jgi:DNA-binding LacI/PurR family transcriptional regulator
VPEDVSVAGFGNILTAENARVPLTTIREPKFRLGLAAMEVMQKLIKNEPVESRLLRADMIIRNSTAIPAVNTML